MVTISELARRFGLSRSTLLYYDRLGLLCPSGRTQGNYRLYSEVDAERLARICALRAANMPLSQVARILDAPREPFRVELEAHLSVLNTRMAELRRQQAQIGTLLGGDPSGRTFPERKAWTAMLRQSGLNDSGMNRFHEIFERTHPEGHASFLATLGLDETEIARIRTCAREENWEVRR